jgi:hypothetical protein
MVEWEPLEFLDNCFPLGRRECRVDAVRRHRVEPLLVGGLAGLAEQPQRFAGVAPSLGGLPDPVGDHVVCQCPVPKPMGDARLADRP